jgi:hypothetical protein
MQPEACLFQVTGTATGKTLSLDRLEYMRLLICRAC